LYRFAFFYKVETVLVAEDFVVSFLSKRATAPGSMISTSFDKDVVGASCVNSDNGLGLLVDGDIKQSKARRRAMPPLLRIICFLPFDVI